MVITVFLGELAGANNSFGAFNVLQVLSAALVMLAVSIMFSLVKEREAIMSMAAMMF